MSTSVSSRSEMLLRSTLLKDELSKNTHRRRGSLSYIDSDDEQVISPHSLSPKQRRHFRSPSLPGPVQLTPHEQVLRARLEHVLEACRSQNQAEHRISKDKRASLPASASSRVFSWLWQDSSTSEEDEDELPSSSPLRTTASNPERSSRPRTPRTRSQTSPIPASPTTPHLRPLSRPQTPRPHSPLSGRPKTPSSPSPHPFVPPSPSFARHAWSADSVPRSQLALRLEQDARTPPSSPLSLPSRRRPTELDLHSSEDCESASPPLSSSSSSSPPFETVPPSPNVTASNYQALDTVLETPEVPQSALGVSSRSPSTPFSPSTRFCARSASQTIKNVDGYVSFGSIEGLGMPDMDTDDSEDDPEGGKKGWKWLTPWKG